MMLNGDDPGRSEQSTEVPAGGRSWRPGHHGSEPVHILNLLYEAWAAEQRLRATRRDALRMGASDLLALRYLLEAQSTGQVMRQKDLAQHLGISTAAVSGLIDRLAGEGYLRRIPHPDDRRSVAIELTATAEDTVRAGLQEVHARMLQAAQELTSSEQQVVAKFLTGLIDACDRPVRD